MIDKSGRVETCPILTTVVGECLPRYRDAQANYFRSLLMDDEDREVPHDVIADGQGGVSGRSRKARRRAQEVGRRMIEVTVGAAQYRRP